MGNPPYVRHHLLSAKWKRWLTTGARSLGLDVNYGRLMRAMFLNELGGQSLTVVEPTARPFSDAAATAVISTFQIGLRPKSIHIRGSRMPAK